MSGPNPSNKVLLFIITAISPIFAAIAIYSLFTPWVSGKLLIVGKTITALNFPNVFWSVLIGCLAIIAVYVRSILTRDTVRNRGIVLVISALTLAAAGYFLYVYSQKPSLPGVRISFRGGLLLCFMSLILSLIGSIATIYIMDSHKFKLKKAKSSRSNLDLPDTNKA